MRNTYVLIIVITTCMTCLMIACGNEVCKDDCFSDWEKCSDDCDKHDDIDSWEPCWDKCDDKNEDCEKDCDSKYPT